MDAEIDLSQFNKKTKSNLGNGSTMEQAKQQGK